MKMLTRLLFDVVNCQAKYTLTLTHTHTHTHTRYYIHKYMCIP